ncbi:hypothetical protein [Dyadobacter sandarakinus]|uniref:Uncharacterized protein n=1 Tax=Dyadobacter sandarakinus TaxID=2747268 RepID=A0ABX7I1P6_9BACT|nr:hypothetical protein [Dyadobacter sandarakinus]QRQ99774.1 hypothetical protein HWI92_01980 [Dyadobacter sandarakinus]
MQQIIGRIDAEISQRTFIYGTRLLGHDPAFATGLGQKWIASSFLCNTFTKLLRWFVIRF